MPKIKNNSSKFIYTDTSNFNNILGPSEITLQKALDKLGSYSPNLSNLKQSINYVENLTQSSTTSSVWQTKLNNTFDLISNNTITISWTSTIWNTTSKIVYCRLLLDGATVLADIIYKPGNNQEKNLFNGTTYRLNLTTGTHTVAIQYNASNAGTTYINNAAIDVVKLI